MHTGWVLLDARPTCMLVVNVTAVFPTVVVVVEGFDVLGIYGLSGDKMAPPQLLLLSSAGVVVSVAWIPIVSVVTSVPAAAVVSLLSFVVAASISLTASTVIFPVFFSGSAFVVVVEKESAMLEEVRDLSYLGTSFVPVVSVVAIVCWLWSIMRCLFESCQKPKKNNLPTAHMLHLHLWWR